MLHAGKFQQARHIERQLSAGVKKDCISDSDSTTGGIKRSRRNGAITQTESNTNTSARSNDSIPPDEVNLYFNTCNLLKHYIMHVLMYQKVNRQHFEEG